MKAITRQDVAKLAEVSVSAVSRVMNKNGYVAKEKREAILKAVKELGYRPSPVAVAMQKRETRQLLFQHRDLGNTFTTDIYRGMVHASIEQGYMVMLSGSVDLSHIKTMMVDGVILWNEGVAVEYNKTMNNVLSIPTVSASYGSSVLRPKGIPFVESDSHAAMELAIDYLFSCGHEKIALATPYPISMGNPRSTAYKSKLLPVFGSDIDKYTFVCSHSKSCPTEEENFYADGEEIAQYIVDSRSDATAVACFNDDIAIGLLNRFHRIGVKVPEDISVIGIDGLELGEYIYPRLTSVNLHPYEQGMECAKVLIGMLNGKKIKGRTNIPITLVERESVCKINRST